MAVTVQVGGSLLTVSGINTQVGGSLLTVSNGYIQTAAGLLQFYQSFQITPLSTTVTLEEPFADDDWYYQSSINGLTAYGSIGSNDLGGGYTLEWLNVNTPDPATQIAITGPSDPGRNCFTEVVIASTYSTPTLTPANATATSWDGTRRTWGWPTYRSAWATTTPQSLVIT